MTTIITRLFPDKAAADSAATRLRIKGVPQTDMHVITDGDRAEAKMQGARVHDSAMKPYLKAIKDGNAVLVVKATYKPLGAARLVRDILASRDTINTGAVTDDFTVPWEPERAASVLKNHPRLLTSGNALAARGRLSKSFGMPLLSSKERKSSVMSGGRHMSTVFWPMPLLSRKERKSSVISGGRQMSKAFWPMPLVSKGERRNSVISGGGFPFSQLFKMPTTT